jgi:PAS domain S-box-containing protein
MHRVEELNISVLDNLPEMYFFLSVSGKILRMNKTAINFLDSSEQQSNIIFDLIELCDREKVVSDFNKSIEQKSSGNLNTRLYVNKNYSDVNISFSFISGGNGNENAVLAVARDITKEKLRELDLLRFYNIVEQSVNPIQITDLNGRMIYVNPALAKSSGYSKHELIGKNPKIFGSGKQSIKFWDKMWQTISSGRTWFGEIEDKKKNGEPYYTQLLISPIVDNDGKINGYFGIHRDLSEKRTLEKQLMQTQKMESIGTLAAGVAHEVGNPLASISALVQVAQRNTTDPFIIEKLGLVKSQITRISKIIRDLVDFSRPSTYELQLTNINKCIQEAVEITKVGTKAKDIDFIVKLHSEVPNLPLVADQLEQVFVNILLNAVDAFGDMMNPKEKRIMVESSADKNEVTIIFSDTGPGIREENLSKIFEPFFTTKIQGKGTGLGLWVSYGIIKSFHGDIKVNSILGDGTTFIIKFPL